MYLERRLAYFAEAIGLGLELYNTIRLIYKWFWSIFYFTALYSSLLAHHNSFKVWACGPKFFTSPYISQILSPCRKVRKSMFWVEKMYICLLQYLEYVNFMKTKVEIILNLNVSNNLSANMITDIFSNLTRPMPFLNIPYHTKPSSFTNIDCIRY